MTQLCSRIFGNSACATSSTTYTETTRICDRLAKIFNLDALRAR